jgi:hypothetical protein
MNNDYELEGIHVSASAFILVGYPLLAQKITYPTLLRIHHSSLVLRHSLSNILLMFDIFFYI